MASLKPNNPSIYDGRRDELSVRTWLYQVQQYLSLIQVGNGQDLTDQTKIAFATSYMTSTGKKSCDEDTLLSWVFPARDQAEASFVSHQAEASSKSDAF